MAGSPDLRGNIRIAIRAVLLGVAMITLICLIPIFALERGGQVMDSILNIPLYVTIVVSASLLFVSIRRARNGDPPINPAWTLPYDLTLLPAMGISVFYACHMVDWCRIWANNVDVQKYPGEYLYVFEAQQLPWWVMVAIETILMFVCHVTLFIMACVDVHRRRVDAKKQKRTSSSLGFAKLVDEAA